MACAHRGFNSRVVVSRLEDSGRFMADVRITCNECGAAMKFVGLTVGLNLDGAAVSFDGTEARLAVVPDGEARPRVSGGVVGFSLQRPALGGA
jgi:hypothetical protein